jgi:hypothetical protein
MHTPEGHLPRDLLSGMRLQPMDYFFLSQTRLRYQFEINFYCAFQQLFEASKCGAWRSRVWQSCE